MAGSSDGVSSFLTFFPFAGALGAGVEVTGSEVSFLASHSLLELSLGHSAEMMPTTTYLTARLLDAVTRKWEATGFTLIQPILLPSPFTSHRRKRFVLSLIST